MSYAGFDHHHEDRPSPSDLDQSGDCRACGYTPTTDEAGGAECPVCGYDGTGPQIPDRRRR